MTNGSGSVRVAPSSYPTGLVYRSVLVSGSARSLAWSSSTAASALDRAGGDAGPQVALAEQVDDHRRDRHEYQPGIELGDLLLAHPVELQQRDRDRHRELLRRLL